MTTTNEPSLDRWDIRRGTEVEWTPWGPNNEARVTVLGEADGYTVALIEAPAGYKSRRSSTSLPHLPPGAATPTAKPTTGPASCSTPLCSNAST